MCEMMDDRTTDAPRWPAPPGRRRRPRRREKGGVPPEGVDHAIRAGIVTLALLLAGGAPPFPIGRDWKQVRSGSDGTSPASVVLASRSAVPHRLRRQGRGEIARIWKNHCRRDESEKPGQVRGELSPK